MNLLLLLVLFFNNVSQGILTDTAVKIADGDTFTLLDSNNKQARIRLHGIDCPERGQDFGSVATKFLGDKLKGQMIQVKVIDIDRYHRIIGKVYVNGEDVNLALLKAGLAWHYKNYDKSIEYAQAEASAKNCKLGLWTQPNTMAPWNGEKVKEELTVFINQREKEIINYFNYDCRLRPQSLELFHVLKTFGHYPHTILNRI